MAIGRRLAGYIAGNPPKLVRKPAQRRDRAVRPMAPLAAEEELAYGPDRGAPGRIDARRALLLQEVQRGGLLGFARRRWAKGKCVDRHKPCGAP